IFFKTLPATSTYTLSLHDALPIFRSRTRLTVAGLSCAWTVESELTIKHENNKTSGGLCMECTWRCDFLHRHSNTIVSREDGTEARLQKRRLVTAFASIWNPLRKAAGQLDENLPGFELMARS